MENRQKECCRVLALQMPTGNDKEKNLKTAERMLSENRDFAPDFVVLPEMFICPYDNSCFPAFAEPEGGAAFLFLSELAKKNHCFLIGGSVPERDREGRIYNTSYVFGRDGVLLARHRKVHLFDIDVPGGQYFRESEVLSPGGGATVFDTEFGKMGVCICFDIRFPRLIEETAAAGAQIIFVPAAFNMTTGPAHWQLLFRARALDEQVWLLGCSPARDTGSSYVAYGHTILTDPWGRVAEELGYGCDVLRREADLSLVRKVRRQIPLGHS